VYVIFNAVISILNTRNSAVVCCQTGCNVMLYVYPRYFICSIVTAAWCCRSEASSAEHGLRQLPSKWSKSTGRSNNWWQVEREAGDWVSAPEKSCSDSTVNFSGLHHVCTTLNDWTKTCQFIATHSRCVLTFSTHLFISTIVFVSKLECTFWSISDHSLRRGSET